MAWLGVALIVGGLLTLTGGVYLYGSVYQPASAIGLTWAFFIGLMWTIGFLMEIAGLFVLIGW